MIYALSIALVWNILNAEHDAWRIKRNRKVNHPANAGLYVALMLVVCFFLGLKYLFVLLPMRPLVFDQWLNVIRGKPINYQPENPESKVDAFENQIFGHKNAWALSNLIYLILFVAGLFIVHL